MEQVPRHGKRAPAGVGIIFRASSLAVFRLEEGQSAASSNKIKLRDEVVAVDGFPVLHPKEAEDLLLGVPGSWVVVTLQRVEGPVIRRYSVELLRGSSGYISLYTTGRQREVEESDGDWILGKDTTEASVWAEQDWTGEDAEMMAVLDHAFPDKASSANHGGRSDPFPSARLVPSVPEDPKYYVAGVSKRFTRVDASGDHTDPSSFVSPEVTRPASPTQSGISYRITSPDPRRPQTFTEQRHFYNPAYDMYGERYEENLIGDSKERPLVGSGEQGKKLHELLPPVLGDKGPMVDPPPLSHPGSSHHIVTVTRTDGATRAVPRGQQVIAAPPGALSKDTKVSGEVLEDVLKEGSFLIKQIESLQTRNPDIYHRSKDC